LDLKFSVRVYNQGINFRLLTELQDSDLYPVITLYLPDFKEDTGYATQQVLELPIAVEVEGATLAIT
jgi:hypothetical protein